MPYKLMQSYRDDKPILEIGRDDYEAIAEAQEKTYIILYVEEKFIYLLENYYELEGDLLADNFRSMHMPQQSHDETVGAIHLFIRRALNVFTASRLYVDHTKQDLKKIGPSGAALSDEFTQRLEVSYDGSFGYRLCEALRNY